jgi:hypothetical protein
MTSANLLLVRCKRGTFEFAELDGEAMKRIGQDKSVDWRSGLGMNSLWDRRLVE